MALNDPGTFVDSPGGKIQAVVPFYFNGTSYVASRGGRRLLYITGSVVGTGADVTEDTLQTYTIPANTLANVGDTIYAVTGGSANGTTDTKVMKLKFGGTAIVQQNMNAAANTKYTSEFWVTKTGPGTQSYTVMSAATGNITTGVLSGVLTKTDTADIVISQTGQNSTNATLNSVTSQFLMVEFIPAP